MLLALPLPAPVQVSPIGRHRGRTPSWPRLPSGGGPVKRVAIRPATALCPRGAPATSPPRGDGADAQPHEGARSRSKWSAYPRTRWRCRSAQAGSLAMACAAAPTTAADGGRWVVARRLAHLQGDADHAALQPPHLGVQLTSRQTPCRAILEKRADCSVHQVDASRRLEATAGTSSRRRPKGSPTLDISHRFLLLTCVS